jgi:hypothetical protein
MISRSANDPCHHPRLHREPLFWCSRSASLIAIARLGRDAKRLLTRSPTCRTCRSSSDAYAGQARRSSKIRLPIHHRSHTCRAGATDVRGFSFFGDSYVYVVFEDGPTCTGRGRGCWNTSTDKS